SSPRAAAGFPEDGGAWVQCVGCRPPAAGGTPQVIDRMRIVYRWPGPVSGIEADDKTVFYTWTDDNETVTVRAQPLDGGASRDLLPPESRFVNTARLVLDGGFVYLQAAQEIVRVPAAGGAPEQGVPHLTPHTR